MAKQIPKFQKVVNFTHLPMTWDQLALSYQTVKNLHQPASVWNWAPPKSTQVEWNTRWIQVENLYWLASLFEARALAGLHMNYSCNKVIADVLMIVTRIPQNCHYVIFKLVAIAITWWLLFRCEEALTLYSQLPKGGHLSKVDTSKVDTSLKQTHAVGPCCTSVIYFISL